MKYYLIALSVINILLISLGLFLYFNNWLPLEGKVTCMQVVLAANNPENASKNYRSCLSLASLER